MSGISRIAMIIAAALGGVLGGVLAGYLIWGRPPVSQAPEGTAALQELDRQTDVPAVAPNDFAVLPCDQELQRSACVIVAAGGKRVLIGAPAGIGSGHLLGEGGIPEAVLLFGLAAGGIEGLDEIRNRIWEMGSSRSVNLVAGEGIEEISAGLDQTYIVPDAVAYVNGRRQGGFGTLPFRPVPVRHGEVAFDTGDLTISALAGGAGQLAYLVSYREMTLALADCGATADDWDRWPVADKYIGCADMGETFAIEADVLWPLQKPVFLIKAE